MKHAIKLSLTYSLALCAALGFGQVNAQPARSSAHPKTGKTNPDPHIISYPQLPDSKLPPNAPMLPYHLVQRAPLPDNIVITLVSGVALTPQGHTVFLTRNPAAMLLEFDKNDKFLRTFDPNITIGPHGLRVDRHGNIWVTDSFLNVVWKLSPKGEPLMVMGTRGENMPWDDSKWNGAFNQPLDVAFDKDDNFYVIQGHGGTSNPLECTYCMTYSQSKPPVAQGSDPRLFKFDKNGMYLASRALPHANGTYPTLHSVIVTPKGEVWAADRQDRVIKVFDTSLNPLREMPETKLVSGLFVDAKGQVWMSAGMDGRIMKLADDGKVLGWIGEPGRSQDPDAPGIGEAHFLAVTPDENTIYMADSVNGKILEWKHN
jgi:sugar lactone lactonase YvrE